MTRRLEWPPTRVEQARRLYIGEGLSAQAVGRRLKVSKNAVLALAQSKGWRRRQGQTMHNLFAANLRRGRADEAVRRPPRHPQPPEPAPDQSFARPWLTRRTGECRWPVGEPERPADQLMCCAPVGGGGDYCPAHRPHMSRRPRDAEAFVEQIMNFLQQKRGSR
jgi:hypothetical protein